MARIEFTDNYQDLSTDTGFQFKFFCESCGNGYMSSWQANKTGIAGDVLRAAGNILGGIFGRASSGSYEIQRAVGGPEHDHALEAAVAEIRPLFLQCKRCGQWVCQRGLLERRAGAVQELRADPAARAGRQAGRRSPSSRPQEKLRADATCTEGVNVTAEATVACPSCGAETAPGKFCAECGASLAAQGGVPEVRREDRRRREVLPGVRAAVDPVTHPCTADGVGLAGPATWQLDESSLVLAPATGSPVTVPLAEIAGIGGDEHEVTLALSGQRLALTRLGADGPGLAAALRARWLPHRAAGLRLTGTGTPRLFSGAVLGGVAPVPFQALLHEDVLLLAPAGGDVEPIFLTLVDSVDHDEAEYAIVLRRGEGGRLRLGRMAAQTAPFIAALRASRAKLAERATATLAANLPRLGLAARMALAARWFPGRFLQVEDLGATVPGFVAAFAASWLAECQRRPHAEHLLTWAEPGRAFVGYGSLDSVPPAGDDADVGGDGAAATPPDALLCLLAGRGERWAFEALSVGDFATYLFTAGPEMPALAAQLLCAPQFSREALYLPIDELIGDQAELAIAARDLPFLVELRRRFAGRVMHGDLATWKRKLA